MRGPARSCGATATRRRPTSIDLHPTSRGVALYGDKVFFARAEAVLVALDARTGKVVWSAQVEDNRKGYYMSLAPLVADGKVMVGASGGELGVRGFVAAYDVETGKQAVEDVHGAGAGRAGQRDLAEGRPVEDRRRLDLGHRQLRSRDQPGVLGHGQRRAVDGRSAARRQPLHRVDDRDRRRHRPDQGPSSIQSQRIVGLGRSVAADSGRLPAQRPHDQRADRCRARRLSVVSRARRRSDQVRRRDAVRETERLPEHRRRKPAGPTSIPRASPAPASSPSSVRPSGAARTGRRSRSVPLTRLLYIPANENLCASIIGREVPYEPGASFVGATIDAVDRARRRSYRRSAGVERRHRQTGVDPQLCRFARTGDRCWRPAGGLVFSGGTNDRKFHAFDATSGKLLWEFPTSSGIVGQPSTFSLDGRQYVAVQSGWGIDSRGMQGRLNALMPGKFPDVPEGGSVWVFAVR